MASTSQLAALAGTMGFGVSEINYASLNLAVADEPIRQPHLISLLESNHLEVPWKTTNSIIELSASETMVPKEIMRKGLIHDHRMIRLSPYNPQVWSGRAATLLGLNYGELAVADAYKATLLSRAFLRPTKEDLAQTPKRSSLTGRVWVTVASEFPKKSQDEGEWLMTLKARVGQSEECAYLIMAQALVGIRALYDAVEFLQLASRRYPANMFFSPLLATMRQKLSGLEQDFKWHGQSADLIERTKKRGRVNRVAYPWIVPGELSRSAHAVKKLEDRFKDVSANTVVAASSIGGKLRDNFGVFASRNICKGEQILTDKSIFCEYNVQGGEYCGACCERLGTKAVSLGCCKSTFCTEECKEEALSTYHKTLCGRDFGWLYEECKDADFDFNETVPLSMVKILAAAVQQNVKPLSLPCVSTLSPDYNSKDKPSFFRLRHNIVAPIKILQTLGIDVFTNTQFESWVIQSLFLRIENNMQGATFGKRTSCGINPFFSMFNHDCEPSAKWGGKDDVTTFGGPIIVSAIRDIKEGEEITISYIPRWLPQSQRREKLRLQLGQMCQCTRCLRERAGGKVESELEDVEGV